MTRMLEHPPLIATNQTPEDIVGPHNMQALAQHIRQYDANSQRVGRTIDKTMGELISRLQAHGYHIDGFESDNSTICFRVVLKSQIQRVFEGPELERIKAMTLEEMKSHARNGYRNMRNDSEFSKLKN